MKAALADVIQTHFKSNEGVRGVTPTASPAISSKVASVVNVPALTPPIPSAAAGAAVQNVVKDTMSPPSNKRVRHGFSLPA